MIDMCVSSHARLALYASSHSYQADASPDYRLEMEGVEFSNIPLLTGDNPALLSQISAQFRGDYSLVRLYAMGMDAPGRWPITSAKCASFRAFRSRAKPARYRQRRIT